MHQLIEATHLGFADGFKHIADSTDKSVLDKLLSMDYARERAQLIKDER